jgi:hypothetical protein
MAHWEPHGYESYQREPSPSTRARRGGGGASPKGGGGCCAAPQRASRRSPPAAAPLTELPAPPAAATPAAAAAGPRRGSSLTKRSPPPRPVTPPQRKRAEPLPSTPAASAPIRAGDTVTLAPPRRVRLYIPVPADLQLRSEVASTGGGAPERGWAREGSGGLCQGEEGRVLAVRPAPSGGGSPRGAQSQAVRVRVENQRGQVCWYEGPQLVRLRGAPETPESQARPEPGSSPQPEPEPEPEPEPAVSVDHRLASPDELEAMATLKQQLADGGWLDRPGTKHMFHVFGGEDKCLVRFLRAYSFKDIQTSFEQFTTSVEYREEHRVAEYTDPQAFIDADPELEMYWPGAYPTFAPDYPVQFFKISHARPAEFVARFPEERLVKFYLVRVLCALLLSLPAARCCCCY